MKKLTSEEFRATFVKPMNEIETLDDGILSDIDEYMFQLFIDKYIKESEYENTYIEHLYENADKAYIHIMFPIKKNFYLVLVCDTKANSIYGHHFSNLDKEYGL
ncbi:hypothetical protein [Metaclostridioides mangenotii]|uniref:hypothetical protein n=1 Tax=Metaclostridioides mangenotii TaxID=1540 RepID=UPI0028F0DFD4|nr:hypothetical protein [Clostridioides mangenotii]